MALNGDGKPFGFSVEDRLKKRNEEPSPVGEKEYTDTPTPTPTKKMRATPAIPSQREKFASAHLPRTRNGERKSERLQLAVRPSTKARLAKYAEDHNTSSNEIAQVLLDDFLDEHGY